MLSGEAEEKRDGRLHNLAHSASVVDANPSTYGSDYVSVGFQEPEGIQLVKIMRKALKESAKSNLDCKEITEPKSLRVTIPGGEEAAESAPGHVLHYPP